MNKATLIKKFNEVLDQLIDSDDAHDALVAVTAAEVTDGEDLDADLDDAIGLAADIIMVMRAAGMRKLLEHADRFSK